MAGVGRRGFAAAAQAALFAQGNPRFGLPSPGLSPTTIYGYPGSMPRFEPGQILSPSGPTSPLDGRVNSPVGSFLNISTDVNGGKFYFIIVSSYVSIILCTQALLHFLLRIRPRHPRQCPDLIPQPITREAQARKSRVQILGPHPQLT